VKGPYHYCFRKLGFDLDDMVLRSDEKERSGVRAVLKLQMGACAMFGTVGTLDLITSSPNVTATSNELIPQIAAHLLDAATKFPTLGLIGVSAWAGKEIYSLYNQVGKPPETNENPDS